MAINCVLLLALALVERSAFLPLRTVDMHLYQEPWVRAAEAAGGRYPRHAFTNYTAFYEHCLALIALFPGPPVLRIKIFAILCDGFLAFAVGTLVPKPRRLLAVAATLALPTVAMNSALLAQSDAIYAAMAVLCISAAMRERSVWAMLAFSAAIAVKLQALLIAPLLVLLWLDRRQPARTILLLPLGYLLFALPMVIAGRPAGETFGVYGQQFTTFAALSNGAPNIWQIGQMLVSHNRGIEIGLPLAIAVTGATILLLWQARTMRTPAGFLLGSAILVMMAVYVTPKMHDRYFYLVDPLMVALTCRNHRFLMPMLLAQAASVFAYLPFILDGYIARDATWGYAELLAPRIAMLPLFGAVAMSTALVGLVGEAWRRKLRSGHAETSRGPLRLSFGLDSYADKEHPFAHLHLLTRKPDPCTVPVNYTSRTSIGKVSEQRTLIRNPR